MTSETSEKGSKPAESTEHLHARISLGRMADTLQDRLRDHDDSKEIRDMLRSLLRDIRFLQNEQGYGAKP